MKMTRIDSFQFGMIMGAIWGLNANPTTACFGHFVAIVSSILYVVDSFYRPNNMGT